MAYSEEEFLLGVVWEMVVVVVLGDWFFVMDISILLLAFIVVTGMRRYFVRFYGLRDEEIFLEVREKFMGRWLDMVKRIDSLMKEIM